MNSPPSVTSPALNEAGFAASKRLVNMQQVGVDAVQADLSLPECKVKCAQELPSGEDVWDKSEWTPMHHKGAPHASCPVTFIFTSRFTCRRASTQIETSAVACGHQRGRGRDLNMLTRSLCPSLLLLSRNQQQEISLVFHDSKTTDSDTLSKPNQPLAFAYQYKMGTHAQGSAQMLNADFNQRSLLLQLRLFL